MTKVVRTQRLGKAVSSKGPCFPWPGVAHVGSLTNSRKQHSVPESCLTQPMRGTSFWSCQIEGTQFSFPHKRNEMVRGALMVDSINLRCHRVLGLYPLPFIFTPTLHPCSQSEFFSMVKFTGLQSLSVQ
jgi:hypothetical protein